MRMSIFLSEFIFSFLFGAVFGQTADTISKEDHYFFGQKAPDKIPEVFAPGIISTGAFEFSITFSSSSDECFFTRRSSFDSYDNRLYYTIIDNDKATEPVPPSFAMDCVETTPYFSPSGSKIYFHSERPRRESVKFNVNDEKIWYSEKNNGEWTNPVFWEGDLNSGFIMGAAVADNEAIYICGEAGGKSGLLKCAPFNNKYDKVEYVLDGLHPFIAPDESYLIYDVIEDEKGDKTALYISFMDSEGKFKNRRRLCNAINKSGNESFGRMSPDGKYFFFQRDGDIYWIEASAILLGN